MAALIVLSLVAAAGHASYSAARPALVPAQQQQQQHELLLAATVDVDWATERVVTRTAATVKSL